METTAVLGLSINTRMVGLAVISGNILVDFHIKLRKDGWTPRKRELILTSLQPWCSSYSINSVALSTPHENQTSTQTRELLESIKRYFSKKKIIFCSYPPSALHSFCQEGKPKTKKEIMRTLAHHYPELTSYYHKEMRNKNKYYIKLFEAVGVATIHAKRVKGKDKSFIGTEL